MRAKDECHRRRGSGARAPRAVPTTQTKRERGMWPCGRSRAPPCSLSARNREGAEGRRGRGESVRRRSCCRFRRPEAPNRGHPTVAAGIRIIAPSAAGRSSSTLCSRLDSGSIRNQRGDLAPHRWMDPASTSCLASPVEGAAVARLAGLDLLSPIAPTTPSGARFRREGRAAALAPRLAEEGAG